MILVDTSVWIDHLRQGSPDLAALLEAGLVLTHPFIVGELALGTIRQRETVLDALGNLPLATGASDEEVMDFINRQRLHGRGIGYVDAHLLAAAMLTPPTRLWTRDRRLLSCAEALGLSHSG